MYVQHGGGLRLLHVMAATFCATGWLCCKPLLNEVTLIVALLFGKGPHAGQMPDIAALHLTPYTVP
jgi:hypothetical protein